MALPGYMSVACKGTIDPLHPVGGVAPFSLLCNARLELIRFTLLLHYQIVGLLGGRQVLDYFKALPE